MKKIIFLTVLTVLVFSSLTPRVFAGPPFNNLEGVGGVAFNPLAYLADSGEEFIKIGDTNIVAKPRFGAWYVNLDDAKIDWTAFGVATTLFKKLEVSYGYETIVWEAHPTFHKNNLGAKLLLLEENSFSAKFVPALSAGTIYKSTSNKSLREAGIATLRSSGQDWYAVATKTVNLLPIPVIISGGVLSTQEYVTGVLGFNNKRKFTGFANIDLVLPHGFVVGYEFKQGARFSNVANTNYWDAHIAWIPNKNLTVIAAYTATGSYNKSGNTRTGLGNGFVLSAQYAF
ncbi:MAG: DUF3034 family protein [Candidatus Omnitrophica bacterium]|nr:DUF3034 family protein [Candidatus Omnitrophota bacterium]